MADNQDVLLKISADIDGLVKGFAGVKGQFKELGNDSEKQARQLARRLEGIFKKVAIGLAAIGTGIAAGLGQSIKEASGFERKMRDVNSIARLSEKQFAAINQEVLGLIRTENLAQGPRSLAEALYDINSAGYKAQDGIEILKVSAKAATAGLTDTRTAADGITTALNAFNLKASDAAMVGDILFKTVEEGKITFPVLSSNLAKVANAANSAGIPLSEVGAGMAALTANGQSAEEAAVALRAAILKIASPMEAQKKAAAEYGIELGAAALRAKGLDGVLRDIGEKTGGDLDKVFSVLREVRATVGTVSLVGPDKGAGFQAQVERFVKANGTLEMARKQALSAFQTNLEQLKSLLSSAAIQIGDTFLPAAKRVVEALKDMVKGFLGLTKEQKEYIAIGAATASAVSLTGAGLIGASIGARALSVSMASLSKLMGGGLFAKALSGGGRFLTMLTGLVTGPVAALIAGLGLAAAFNFGGLLDSLREVKKEVVAAFQTIDRSALESGIDLREFASLIGRGLTLAFSIAATAAETTFGLIVVTARTGIGLAIDTVTSLLSTIVGVAGGIGKTIDKLLSLDLLGAVQELGRTIGTVFQEFFGWIVKVIYRFVDVEERVENLGDLIRERLGPAFDYVFGEDSQAQTEKFAKNLEGSIRAAIEKITTDYLPKLRDTTREIMGEFSSTFEKHLGFAAKSLESWAEKARDIGKTGASGLGSLLSRPRDMIADLLGSKGIDSRKTEQYEAGVKAAADKQAAEEERKARDKAAKQVADREAKTRAHKIARIRQLDPEAAGVDGLREALDPALKTLENAQKNGIPLYLTSGRRHGSGPSDHNVGNAADFNLPAGFSYKGKVLSADERNSLINELMRGTGFAKSINEQSYENRLAVGSAGPGFDGGSHTHGTTNPLQGDIFSSGKNIVESLAGSVEVFKEIDKDLETGKEELMRLYDSSPIRTLKANRESEFAQFQAVAPGDAFQNSAIGAALNSLQGKGFSPGGPKATQVPLQGDGETAGIFKTMLDKEIEAMTKVREAGLMSNQETLSAVRDRIAEEIRLETLSKDEKLEALYAFRQAENTIREEKLAQIQLDKENELISSEEEKARQIEVLTESAARLQEFGIVTTDIMSQVTRIAKDSTDSVSELSTNVVNSMSNGFTSFLSGTLSGQTQFKDAFTTLWQGIRQAVVQNLVAMIAKTKVYIAIMSVLKSLMNSVFGIFGGAGSLLSGGSGAGAGALAGLNIGSFHSGGGIFSNGGLLQGGVNTLPDEYLAKLRTDELVLNRNDTRDFLNGGLGGSNGPVQHVENQNFYGGNVNEISQTLGRNLASEFRGRVNI